MPSVEAGGELTRNVGDSYPMLMTDGELVRTVGASEVELRFTPSPPVWFSRLPVHDCVLYECFLSLGCVCGGTRKDFCLYRWVVIKLIPVQMSYLCILYYNYHYICVFCTIIITNNVCEQKVLVLRQLQNEGHFLPSFFFFYPSLLYIMGCVNYWLPC